MRGIAVALVVVYHFVAAAFILYVGLTLAAAWLLFVTVERPMLALKVRFR
jgi:peptidoglycan/LPS O-acetylase OafA/YrhL